MATAALTRLIAATRKITTTSSRISAPMNTGRPVLVRNSCDSVFESTAATPPVTTRPPNIQPNTWRMNEVSDRATLGCSM